MTATQTPTVLDLDPAEFDAAAQRRAPRISRPSPAYADRSDGRDLRLDFLRGLAMVVVVINHSHLASLFDLLCTERFGVFSAAEAFVLISGLVLGMTHRRRVQRDGLARSTASLFDRSLQLYRVSIVIAASVLLLRQIPASIFDTTVLTSWRDRIGGHTVSIYPTHHDRWRKLADLLLMRYGPADFNIMGLYVMLLAMAPLAVWLLSVGRVKLLLALSWVAYIASTAYPTGLTGAAFERPFPVLTWQLVFVHGLAAGYHRSQILAWLTGWRLRSVLLGAAAAFVLLWFFALNNYWVPVPFNARLHLIAPQTFDAIYGRFFLRRELLGPGRLLNVAVALIVFYALLTHYWRPLSRYLGWLFIPIGQATLYVFILHVYLRAILDNIPIVHRNHLLTNALAQVALVLALWLLVRTRFCFRWIPR